MQEFYLITGIALYVSHQAKVTIQGSYPRDSEKN